MIKFEIIIFFVMISIMKRVVISYILIILLLIFIFYMYTISKRMEKFSQQCYCTTELFIEPPLSQPTDSNFKK